MSSPKKIKRAVINRAHIELVIVLIADVILYFKMENASFNAEGLLLAFLSLVAFLMTIAGTVSLIMEADKWIGEQKTDFYAKNLLVSQNFSWNPICNSWVLPIVSNDI